MLKYVYIFIIHFIFTLMFSHHPYFTDMQTIDLRNFAIKNKKNKDLIISRLMLSIGFKLHLCGSTYLRESIAYCLTLPQDTKINFSADVYPYIAKKHNTMARSVEKNIRTAIHNCYYNGNMLSFNDLCGYKTVSKSYPPTNADFIMSAVDLINFYESTSDVEAEH